MEIRCVAMCRLIWNSSVVGVSCVRPQGFAGRTLECGRENRDLYEPWRLQSLVGEPAFQAYRGEESFAVCCENRTGGWLYAGSGLMAAPAYLLGFRDCMSLGNFPEKKYANDRG